ncbi:MAG: acetyl-CoA carboxylase biotin carboxyl carrier protein subunit [Planctomycetes bacterium]|nr:acetyl-CoA carboxylase biotin carboxyl carrier protein subunit [Planctomycetota bacterium]
MSIRRDFVHDGQPLTVQLKPLGGARYAVQVGTHVYEVEATVLPDGRVRFHLDGKSHLVEAAPSGKQVQVRLDGHTWILEPSRGRARAGHDAGSGVIEAPMTGTIAKVLVEVGSAVEKGATLVVLTAMKMEHKLVSGIAGRVVEVTAREGATVDQGALLARVEP